MSLRNDSHKEQRDRERHAKERVAQLHGFNTLRWTNRGSTQASEALGADSWEEPEIKDAIRSRGQALWVEERHSTREPPEPSIRDRHRDKRVVTALDGDATARDRGVLRALVARPLQLPSDEAWIAFALRAASRAPLVSLERDEDDLVDVWANMGAGNLLRIHAIEFPEEVQEPLALCKRGWDYNETWHKVDWTLDGGDIVILLDPAKATALEGSTLPRKRDEGSDDDNDDDNDDSGSYDPDAPICEEFD